MKITVNFVQRKYAVPFVRVSKGSHSRKVFEVTGTVGEIMGAHGRAIVSDKYFDGAETFRNVTNNSGALIITYNRYQRDNEETVFGVCRKGLRYLGCNLYGDLYVKFEQA